MRACFLFSIFVLSLNFARSGEATFGARKFYMADGFEMSLVVPSTLVGRPIEACFDEQGNLFVTESSGSNDPVGVQAEARTHRVVRLSDRDGDGTFETKTIYAEGLMFPEGILCHQGAVYVATPPEIYKFTDENNDGVAEARVVWFDGKTLTGCANDLHGPYLGPDGLIYWCKGAFAAQTYDLPGKPGWKTRASHVFRANVDGTGIECVFTAGMDNPVGVAWTPEGDLMVSGTFLQHPEAGRRDGIIHAVRGGVWGKDHDVLEGHPRTGALLPPMTHLGPAAAASLCRYDRDLLACQFNLRCVSRHKLIPDGATYRTEDSTLVSSEHPDFHPTDVLQAPDGSILVVDTGGWYKLCCPTSQLAKPDVLGGIYRLRAQGAAVPVASPPPLWKLAPLENAASLQEQLLAPNLHIRRSAIEAAGQWPGIQKTQEDRQAASTAIVPLLLKAAQGFETDRFLEHAIIYALMEGADPAAMSKSLANANAHETKLLLYALAQTNPAALAVEQLTEILTKSDAAVLTALQFSFTKVPAWKSAASTWVHEHLPAQPLATMTLFLDKLSVTQADMLPDLAKLLQQATDPALRSKLITAMRGLAAKAVWPTSWVKPILQSLRAADAAEREAAAEFCAACQPTTEASFHEQLSAFASNPEAPAALRLLILSNAGQSAAALANFPLLLEMLTHVNQVHRLRAAQIISRLQPDSAQLQRLSEFVPKAGLLERPFLMRAYRLCSDEATGSKLLDALEAAGIMPTLSEQVLTESLAKFPEPLKARAKAAQTQHGQDREAQLQRLTNLEKSLPAGDLMRGSLVFHSAKSSCLLCHKIGYKGGTLGPDLTKVGSVRTQRDLLEAVLFPNASFVRSYEPIVAELTDGTKHYGVIRNQSSDTITLATSVATPDVTLRLAEVKSLTAGPAGMMPSSFEQLLSTEELADLVAYLQSLK